MAHLDTEVYILASQFYITLPISYIIYHGQREVDRQRGGRRPRPRGAGVLRHPTPRIVVGSGNRPLFIYYKSNSKTCTTVNSDMKRTSIHTNHCKLTSFYLQPVLQKNAPDRKVGEEELIHTYSFRGTSHHPLGHELSLRRRLVHHRRARGGRGPCGKDVLAQDETKLPLDPPSRQEGEGEALIYITLVGSSLTPDRFQISTPGRPRTAQVSTGSTPLSPSTWGITPTKR